MKIFLFSILLFMLSVASYSMPPLPDTDSVYDGSRKPKVEASSFSRVSVFSGDSISGDISSLGTKNILVILVNYNGMSFDPTRNTDYYKRLLEEDPSNPSKLTVAQYYNDISCGKHKLNFTVLGPFDAQYGYDYYGANNEKGNDIRPATLVREAINKAIIAKKSTANFFDKFDNNNNGYIDAVFIVHAGPGEEANTAYPNYIWAHSWDLYSAWYFNDRGGTSESTETSNGTIRTSNKIFNQYILCPEFYSVGSKKEASIGVFCHEYGHKLGLSDLYDTTYETNGVGNWSLMGTGSWGSSGMYGTVPGTDPAPMLAWERAALGWITPLVVTPSSSRQILTLNNIDLSSESCRINLTADGNQYLFLEGKKHNRTGVGKYVPEDGFLVTHICNEVISSKFASKAINNESKKVHGINIIEAVSEYYLASDTKGTGDLWHDKRTTTTALFRKATRDFIKPEYEILNSGADVWFSPFMTAFFNTAFFSAVVIAFIITAYRRRLKLCAILAAILTISVFCISCDMVAGSGGGDEDEKDIDVSHPNTNYYMNMNRIGSKSGISGITISDMNYDAEADSGSFAVVKE